MGHDITGYPRLIAIASRRLLHIGGSRAQLDLVEFTLLQAYLSADRLDEGRRMLKGRHRGSARPPVAGLAAVH
jgi:hypothetical protein